LTFNTDISNFVFKKTSMDTNDLTPAEKSFRENAEILLQTNQRYLELCDQLEDAIQSLSDIKPEDECKSRFAKCICGTFKNLFF
jgi:hypothetical protein